MINLRLGDCLAELALMPSGNIPCVITDIPYNEVNRPTAGLRQINKGGADSTPVDIERVVAELVRIISGSIYVWCGMEQVSLLRSLFVKAGLSTRVCVWHKSNPSPMNGQHLWLSGLELCVFARKKGATFNRFCANPIWRGPSQRVKGFSCPKPVWLMKELIEASSNVGDVILDPFMGSGSTGVGCIETDRDFIGIELNPVTFALAQERLKGD